LYEENSQPRQLDRVKTAHQCYLPDLENLVEETDMQIVEKEIDEQAEQFHSVVSSYIDNHKIHMKSEHDPIPNSATILALDDVKKIVHNKSYLICQNRDLCREFFHVACLLVPEKSEIASDVTLSWQNELENALFNANFVNNVQCIDNLRLANVMSRLINCIQIHEKLDKGRTYHKKLLAFARKNKTKAFKKRKEQISCAWLDFPGFKQLRALREARLEKIQHEFFEETNWQRVKRMFETSLERDEEILQKYAPPNRYRRKQEDWADDSGEMNFDESPDGNSDSVEQDDHNGMEDQDMTVTPNRDDESKYSDPHNQDHMKSEIEEPKQDAIITHSVDTYVIWARRINRISIPDNIKSELNRTIESLKRKVRLTTIAGGIETEIGVLLALFKQKLGRLNERRLTKDTNELGYRCNLELQVRINALKRPIDSISIKNLTVLKSMLKESSTKDFQKDNKVRRTTLTTAYTNPYLI